MNGKFGKLFIDGQLVDLDNMPIDKLEKIKVKLEEKEKTIREEIEKILNDDENERGGENGK